MPDNVTELRARARRMEGWLDQQATTALLRSAADEIERLRADVARLRKAMMDVLAAGFEEACLAPSIRQRCAEALAEVTDANQDE